MCIRDRGNDYLYKATSAFTAYTPLPVMPAADDGLGLWATKDLIFAGASPNKINVYKPCGSALGYSLTTAGYSTPLSIAVDYSRNVYALSLIHIYEEQAWVARALDEVQKETGYVLQDIPPGFLPSPLPEGKPGSFLPEALTTPQPGFDLPRRSPRAGERVPPVRRGRPLAPPFRRSARPWG